MIKKALFQGMIVAISFVAVWFLLSQVDFIKTFNVNKVTSGTSDKLGNMLWETIEKTETVIRNDSVTKPVQKLIDNLAEKNNIDGKKIKLHIVQKDEINAFALPGNHLVVYTGLITDCENESQLAGVLGHEIAHIEKNHVMKKLVKEIGLSLLISMTTGGNGQQAVKKIAQMLSSSAYDRTLETEADLTSVDYLIKANLDPEQFANFMFKMANNKDMPEEFYWISTHPESEERAKEIVAYIKDKKVDKKAFLTSKEWNSMQKKTKNY